VGALLGGAVSDALLRRGVSPERARKTLPILGGASGAVAIWLAMVASSPWLSVAFLALYLFLSSAAYAGFWSMPFELHREATGSVSSVMNFGGNLGGTLAPWISGNLVRTTGNLALPFYTISAMSLVMALVLAFLLKLRPISSSLPVSEARA
jgi:nitrate/nitrite transporter NarK